MFNEDDANVLYDLFSTNISSNDDLQNDSYNKKIILYLKPILHLINLDGGGTVEQPINVQLEFKLYSDKYSNGYIIRNLKKFICDVCSNNYITMGKRLAFYGNEAEFAVGTSQKLWQMLLDIAQDEIAVNNQVEFLTYSYYVTDYEHKDHKSVFYSKYLKLSPNNLDRFIQIMGKEPFTYEFRMDIRDAIPRYTDEVFLCKDESPICIYIAKKIDYNLVYMSVGVMIYFGKNNKYIIQGHSLYIMENQAGVEMFQLQMAFHQYNNRLKIKDNNLHDFLTKIVPKLEEIVPVVIDENMGEKYLRPILETDIFMDYYEDGLAARIIFKYDFYEINPLIDIRENINTKDKIIIRTIKLEEQVLNFFKKFNFIAGNQEWRGWFILNNEEDSYNFIKHLPELSKIANVHCVNIKDFTVSAKSISIGVRITDKNILELSTRNKEYNFEELMQIFTSYKNKKSYHRLKDGRFMLLENQQLDKLAGLLGNVSKAQIKNDVIEMPLARASYIDSLGRGDDALKLERDRRFRSVVKAIRNPELNEMDIPDYLQDILREYQNTGVNWLGILAKMNLGGILADDMGLGKTLQVIAFIIAKKRETIAGWEPALVVAPTSLLFNWLEEIKKFAPDLKAVAIAGTKTERDELLKDVTGQDIVITTYNMLMKDVYIYQEKYFSYCFIDEAQHIKNPVTQKAKAVKKIKAGGYFALTGTPLENTLTELWSIFDFIMPGYLYSHDKFRKRFEIPIIKSNDEAAYNDLYCHISPFILRRLKKDVLQELPEKLERRMLNEMTSKQSKIYDAYFVQAKKELAQELANNGFEKSRIKILAILTRLRQIACDPAIFLEDYTGGSGKLDMLQDLVQESVDSGHRILIFSQFTQMLQRIGQRLRKMGVAFYYLDGGTKALDRINLVNNFNENKENVPVFLISLKAGGTGLNLTGADIVINYDPWWNPAVEEQAADRAYRIGQQRNVQVIKLITKDSIEEQIYELQEKKKALLDKILKPGESFLTKLSEEEIRKLFI